MDNGFSIVIVTWRNYQYAIKCIKSIIEHSYYDHQIILVHNEYDKTMWEKMSADLPNKHKVEEVAFCTNVGLSKAANRGSEYAKRRYICLIDDDCEVFEGWDYALWEGLSPKKTNWVASTRIEPIAPHYNISIKDWRNGVYPEKWYHNISNTPLLIPIGFWFEIGGYDTDFPNVGAELGLAKKAYERGEDLFLQTPHSIVYHYQSQSMKRLKHKRLLWKERDTKFKEKHGISRKEFKKIIKKGEEYHG